jgi:hypothetical protein
MSKYYYVTTAAGAEFIKEFGQYAVKSLLACGVSGKDIHVVTNDKQDKELLQKLIPVSFNIYVAKENLSIAKWKYAKGKRKYSLLKAAGLYKFFPKPIKGKYMIYFDGDVLWYKKPDKFFDKYCEKTWFHHGKSLDKRSSLGKKDIDPSNYKQLSQWCSAPQAHVMVKFGAEVVPDREVVAGLYLMHPRDHKRVIKLTYKGCLENCDKFQNHEGGGDQKPMNAALCIANVDWHGGSRFFCPEHKKYFDHFFGSKSLKKIFKKKVSEIILI